jgi:biotin-(acetyl-CoA carboxylase) ligase
LQELLFKTVFDFQCCISGRGGNSWLSPVGCAMFSLHVKMPLDSKLGKVVSYLQHITALAVVYSVCKLPGYEVLHCVFFLELFVANW